MRVLFFMLVITSCVPDKPKEINKKIERKGYELITEKIDGCEYIVINGIYGRSIIHKQNCKNH